MSPAAGTASAPTPANGRAPRWWPRADPDGGQAALDAFFADLALLPQTHPRRLGLLLMQVAMAGALASLCLGLAAMHICCGLAAVGGLMARAPIHRLPGFWLAITFT